MCVHVWAHLCVCVCVCVCAPVQSLPKHKMPLESNQHLVGLVVVKERE